MPIKLKPGEVVEGRYRIEAGVHTGNFAISYKSTRIHDNCPAFFKQYLSPTKMTPWYRQYQQQVHDFKARIESDVVCKDICYQFYDIFEHRSSLCMTFEWAENGLDLKAALARPTTTWADRVTLA